MYRGCFNACVVCFVCMASLSLAGKVDAAKEESWLGAVKAVSPVKANKVKWFTDARFGLFIHWGPVTLTGHEIGWSRGEHTPVEEYDQLYKQFNPVKFDAAEWVQIAKDAGMKYLVITTKHHDGFCLWDTKEIDYNIMNSPFKRDVVKELADACHEAGIAFCVYYSVVDWYHPDWPSYHPRPGWPLPDGEKPNIDRYITYMKAQLKELCTNYGDMDLIWFDIGFQEHAGEGNHRGIDLHNYVLSLNPNIIINERCNSPMHDFVTSEQKTGEFNRKKPWETCMTICNQWAWKPNDDMKSLTQCLHTLILSAAGDGNLLFNVGPTAEGDIEPRQVKRLKEMGNWLTQYGHSIYGTRGGPYIPAAGIASTCKGNKVYLHLLQDSLTNCTIPSLGLPVQSYRLLTGGELDFKDVNDSYVITIAQEDMHEIDTLIELTIDGNAGAIEPIQLSELNFKSVQMASVHATDVYANSQDYNGEKAFDGDDKTRWACNAGTKSVTLEWTFKRSEHLDGVSINEVFGRVLHFNLHIQRQGIWQKVYEGRVIGSNKIIRLPNLSVDAMRLEILDAVEGPTINKIDFFGEDAYFDDVSDTNDTYVDEAMSTTRKNLALEGIATQISTSFNGTADLAIDNNTNGFFSFSDNSVTHSSGGSNAGVWWQIDLGATCLVEEIEIFNRQDANVDFLSNYIVLLSRKPFPKGDVSAKRLAQITSVWSQSQNKSAGHPTTIPVDARGRYLRIQLTAPQQPLHLAELRIWGYQPLNHVPSTEHNDQK